MDYLEPKRRARQICGEVGLLYDVDVMDLSKRTRDVTKARHIAIRRIKSELPWSTSKIANFFGYRDHTIIVYVLHKGNPNYGEQESDREGAC